MVLCGPIAGSGKNRIKIGIEEYHIIQVGRKGGAVTRIFTFTGNGKKKAEFAGGRVVVTFLEDRVVLLSEKHVLNSYLPGETAPVVASLNGNDLPSLQSIKGMAVGENQVVLVRDDGYFLVYRRDP
jgi:hypothetical protein